MIDVKTPLLSLALRHAKAYLACFTVTYVTASVSQSMNIMHMLQGIGIRLPLGTRLQVIGHDLVGLTFWADMPLSYGECLLIGFAIALPIASLICRWVPALRTMIFAAAGATSVATILYLIDLSFFYDMTLLEGTRGILGYGLQLLAGALGGVVYAISAPEPKTQ